MKTAFLLSVSIRGWIVLVAALPRCAVLPIANGQGFGGVPASRPGRSPAGWHPAIQQTDSLRYKYHRSAKQIQPFQAAGVAELESSARGDPMRRSLVVVSRRCAQRRGQSAFLLEECLVYLVVSSILLGLAFAAFYRVLDNAKSVRRNAADISRVLQAGERWRTDIHQATDPLELVSLEGAIEQALQQTAGESSISIPGDSPPLVGQRTD